MFTTTANISYIDLEIGNIKNPIPSMITDPFVGYVGNDYSAYDNKAAVFIDPAPLNSF